ncbi:50S ribosomal protein L22 [Candidatus Daviesbacteria bacterium]|nr:50S ribosomal protein L22 [Candidatus Daviesbacteria bacterium]
MEAQTIQKYMHTSPRKLRLVASLVRKMEPVKALEALRFSNKDAGGDLIKAIKAVMANARIKGMENLSFKAIEVQEGPKMRRFRAGARGRARPYKRKMSNIKIILTDEKGGEFEARNTKHETNSK